MRWRRLLGPRVILAGDRVVEQALWRDFEVPLANIVDASIEWVPWSSRSKMTLTSDVGNRLRFDPDEVSQDLRAAVGQAIEARGRGRHLSDATRDALMLPPLRR